MRKHDTKLQILPKKHPLFIFQSAEVFNPDQKKKREVVLEQRCMMLSYLCTTIMIALKFKYHLCEVSLEGMQVILQQVQHGSDWADGDFFEPNNQGLCSSKNA